MAKTFEQITSEAKSAKVIGKGQARLETNAPLPIADAATIGKAGFSIKPLGKSGNTHSYILTEKT